MTDVIRANGLQNVMGRWHWARLGEVAQLRPAKSVSTNGDTEVRAITTACLTESGFKASGVKRAQMWARDAAESVVSPGEVLVARSNTPELVGRACLYNGEVPGAVASDLTIRIWPGSALHPPFLAAYLSYLYLSGYWRERAGGASGSMKKITRTQILDVLVPLPPLSVQARIATAVTANLQIVDQGWLAVRAQLDATQTLVSAYLRAAFTGAAAASWPVRPIRTVCSVSGGIQKSPDRVPRVFHRPFLTVRNVQRGWLDLTEVEHFEITEEELVCYQLISGDVLVVEGNGSAGQIGRNAVFRGEIPECIHQNHLIRVRPDPGSIDSDFLSYYLNSPPGRVQLIQKARSSTGLYTLSVSKVENLIVPVPPLPEQGRVVASLADQLTATNRLRSTLEQQSTVIEQLSGALLRLTFKGEE